MSKSLIEQFADYKRVMKLRDKTITEYCQHIEKFESWYLAKFNKQRMALATWKNIDRKTAQEYIVELREALSINSVKKITASLIQYYRYLQVEHGIEINLFTGLEIPKDIFTKEKKYITQEQGEAMFNMADSVYHKLMLGNMLYLGMRIEECSSIEVKNVSLDNMEVSFVRKNQRLRTLPIRKQLKSLYIERIAYCRARGHKYLFQSKSTGKPLTTKAIRDVFNTYRDELELSKDITPHQMRKLLCTSLYYDHKMLLHEVSQILDHSSTKVTETYLIGYSKGRVISKFSEM